MTRESLLKAVWRSHRSLVGAVAALILANLLVLVLYQTWLAPRTYALQREFLQSQERLRDLRRREGTAGTLRSGLDAVEADLKRFREAIPSRLEFTELVGEIFDLAGAAGLVIEAIGYQPEPLPEAGLLQYTLNFSVTGSYEQVKQFIHALEQSERLVGVERIALSGGEPTEDEVNLRLRLTTYFRTGEEA